jgi:hypothetical protein
VRAVLCRIFTLLLEPVNALAFMPSTQITINHQLALAQFSTRRLRSRTGQVMTHTDCISPSWVDKKIALTGNPFRLAKIPGRV